MKLKIFILTLFFIATIISTSCVDGQYDPEKRWELNCQEIDGCEENDSFDAAYDVSSDLELLYLNFFDDIIDYYIVYFSSDSTYQILADVPFDHLSDTVVAVYAANHDILKQSSEPDDERDSLITGFSPPQSGNYYVGVFNTFSSGTGELRGYSLLIEEEE